jgi:methyl-accepting chemotaxis protein
MGLKVKQKITGLALLAAALPVIATIIISFILNAQISEQAELDLKADAERKLKQIAMDVHNMLSVADAEIDKKLEGGMKMSEYLANQNGGMNLSPQMVNLTITDQYTKETKNVTIPQLRMGTIPIMLNTSPDTKAIIADDVTGILGGLYTVYQRVNEEGDMVRLSTNVLKDGKRAAGTYLPAMVDGKAHPIVSTVISGKTFKGNAFVIDAWYKGIYKPFFDNMGRVIGMYSMAIKQEENQELRQNIMDIRVGKTGYVWIMGGKKKEIRGHYIISAGGAADGKDILNVKDDDGRPVIQLMIDQAMARDTVSYFEYPWKNEGEDAARDKIAGLYYFEPWDWVIGPSAYIEEFYEARDNIVAGLDNLLMMTIGAGVILLVLFIIFSMYVGGKIANPIIQISEASKAMAIGDLSKKVDVTTDDEVGEMAKSFKHMSAAIKDVIGEVNMLIDSTTAGKLDVRGDSGKFKGEYSNMIKGTNGILDAIINPLNMTAEYVDRISKGDIPPVITEEYRGDFNEIKNNLNGLIDVMNSLVSDVGSLADAASIGKLRERANADIHQGDFKKLVNGINTTLDLIVALLDKMPIVVMAIDNDFNINFMNETGAGLDNKSGLGIQGSKCFDHFKTSHCKTGDCACEQAVQQGKDCTMETDAHPGIHNLEIKYTGTPIKDDAGKTVGAYEFVIDQTDIKNAMNAAEQEQEYVKLLISDTTELVNAAVDGQLQERIDTSRHQGDYYNVVEGINTLLDGVLAPVTEAVDVLKQMADGDMTVTMDGEFKGDHAILKQAINDTLDSINELLIQVMETVGQVDQGAVQVSDASSSLSQSATEQAASLEEMTSSMAEIGSQTKQNAENANHANGLAKESLESSEKGDSEMQELMMAMNEINESSKNIQKIIKVIDEIAFQTNLLALNAAVEAARAGVHGKGFAVVAEEVRNLAARSAKAAKETAEMIEGSIKTVDNGAALSQRTSEVLAEIKNHSTKVADIVAEISVASNEQAQGISQINIGLEQLDNVTQQNTASSEESASAAEELSGQAKQLSKMIATFKLRTSQQHSSTFDAGGTDLNTRKGKLLQSGGSDNDLGVTADEMDNLEIKLDEMDDSDFGKY